MIKREKYLEKCAGITNVVIASEATIVSLLTLAFSQTPVIQHKQTRLINVAMEITVDGWPGECANSFMKGRHLHKLDSLLAQPDTAEVQSNKAAKQMNVNVGTMTIVEDCLTAPSLTNP